MAIFFCQSDTSVLRFEKDAPLKLTDDIVAVAVTPPLATGLDVQKMPTRNFTSVGERSGPYPYPFPYPYPYPYF